MTEKRTNYLIAELEKEVDKEACFVDKWKDLSIPHYNWHTGRLAGLTDAIRYIKTVRKGLDVDYWKRQ